MAELARGNVTDRPWGRTLAALGLRGVSGQLTVVADGKSHHVLFGHGAVIGAGSPLASDSAVRIAVTGHLVTSTQVAEFARRQAAAPERDEFQLITELARLGPDQVMRLRRRVVAQRAARTFALDRGEFIIEDEHTVPIVAGIEIDIRAVIYLGARQFLSESRLNSELGKLGAWFQLTPEAIEDLGQFGFADPERPVLDALREGAGLRELEAAGDEQRMVRSVVYALVSCGACVVESIARPPAKAKPVAPTLSRPAMADARDAPTIPRRAMPAAADGPTISRRDAAAIPDPPTIARATPASASAEPGSGGASGSATDEATRRRAAPSDPSTTYRRQPSSSSMPDRKRSESVPAMDLAAVIKARIELLDQGADHFQLLGVTPDAAPDQIRAAYFALARQLHPDRLAAVGVDDTTRTGQRLFAEVNAAFAVLSDPKRRFEYAGILSRGGEKVVAAEQAQAEQMAMRVLDSEEAFRRAEMAMRRDQMTSAIRELEAAIELNPDEADYHAALAWARFCVAVDKMSVSAATRSALEHAIATAPKAVSPRFYLGRVERMLGKDEEARGHFQAVLKLAPHHTEASSELRVLDARLASIAGKDKGSGRTKR